MRLDPSWSLVALLLCTGCAGTAQPEPEPAPAVAAKAEPRIAEAAPRPHEQSKCGSCGPAQPHTLPDLALHEWREQIARYASEPLRDGSPALETLLFHNQRSSEYLARYGAPELDPAHLTFLKQELARDHVLVAMRLVDSKGVERLTLKPTHVPLRVRKHVHSSHTENLQPAEVSGTVVRVGLDRLWVRY